MVEIIDEQQGQDVSIIVPHLSKRDKFFYEYVLPSLTENDPKEIIIVSDSGKAPVQRNKGFDVSTSSYITFWDDDSIMPSGYISKLIDALKSNKNYDFAYTGFLGFVTDPSVQPNHNFEIKSHPWDVETLKKGNYVTTESVIKRESYVDIRWDERLKRFQDWDLYIQFAKKGRSGLFVNNLQYMKFFLDEGITSKGNNLQDAYRVLVNKHPDFFIKK